MMTTTISVWGQKQASEETADLCTVPKDEIISSEQELNWTGAWDAYITENGGSVTKDALVERSFKISDLKSYIGKDSLGKDSLVIRIYFATYSTPIKGFAYVPDLILVKGGPCNEDTQNALLASATGTSTISISDASKYIKAYANHMNSIDLPKVIEREIVARTFSMTSVSDFINDDLYNQLYFYFMLRPKDPGNPIKPGSNPELFDICMMGVEADVAKTVYVNFAQPCPRLCDFGSALYKATQ